MNIKARKFNADSIVNEEQIPVNEWVDVVVYAEGTNGEADEVIYCQKHKIAEENVNISIKVNRRPIKAGIDPYYQYIDKIVSDTIVKTEELEE